MVHWWHGDTSQRPCLVNPECDKAKADPQWGLQNFQSLALPPLLLCIAGLSLDYTAIQETFTPHPFLSPYSESDLSDDLLLKRLHFLPLFPHKHFPRVLCTFHPVAAPASHWTQKTTYTALRIL